MSDIEVTCNGYAPRFRRFAVDTKEVHANGRTTYNRYWIHRSEAETAQQAIELVTARLIAQQLLGAPQRPVRDGQLNDDLACLR